MSDTNVRASASEDGATQRQAVVFLWASDEGRRTAEAMVEWLRMVFGDLVAPLMLNADKPMQDWLDVPGLPLGIIIQLRSYGVKASLAFRAGELASRLGMTRTLVVNASSARTVAAPLRQFVVVNADREGASTLAAWVNAALMKSGLSHEDLRVRCDDRWPWLDYHLRDARAGALDQFRSRGHAERSPERAELSREDAERLRDVERLREDAERFRRSELLPHGIDIERLREYEERRALEAPGERTMGELDEIDILDLKRQRARHALTAELGIPNSFDELPAPDAYIPVNVFFATSRKATAAPKISEQYSDERGPLSFGTATVSIPHQHRPGRLESRLWTRLEFEEDPLKHLMVVSVERTEEGDWLATMNETIQQSRSKDVMVFVHGFNVGFEDALRRCAQFAYDVKFEGPLVAFSWPSKRLLRAYLADESTVLGSAPKYLASVLHSLRLRPGIGNIQIVAHSMGARLVNAALSILAQKQSEFAADQLVLAAADLDQEALVESAGILSAIANRVSLYTSAMDFAIAISAWLHNYPRAGTGGKRILVVDGVDTMDASRFGLNWLGHGYFAENKAVIDDLFLLLNKKLAPPDRNLRKVPYPPSCYWAFQ